MTDDGINQFEDEDVEGHKILKATQKATQRAVSRTDTGDEEDVEGHKAMKATANRVV